MSEQKTYTETLIRLVTPLVGEPEFMKVDERREESAVTLTLAVHPDDMGRIIGRGGETIRGVRNLIEFAGTQAGDSVLVDIKE